MTRRDDSAGEYLPPRKRGLTGGTSVPRALSTPTPPDTPASSRPGTPPNTPASSRPGTPTRGGDHTGNGGGRSGGSEGGEEGEQLT